MSSLSVFIVFKLDSGALGAAFYVPLMLGDRHNDGEVYGLGTDAAFLLSAPDTLNVFAGPNASAHAVVHNCVAYGQWKNLNVVSDRTIWNTTIRVEGAVAPVFTTGINMLLSVPLGNPTGSGVGGIGEPEVGEIPSKSSPGRLVAKCDIAEVIVYGVALPDSLRRAVEQYLGNKYHLSPGV